MQDAIEKQTEHMKSFLEEKLDTWKEDNAAADRLIDLNAAMFITRALQSTFYKNLVDCLKCVICCNIATPTIVFATCCESILGCETCLRQWYTGNTFCPKCRNEGGENSLHPFRGFDDIVKNMRI